MRRSQRRRRSLSLSARLPSAGSISKESGGTPTSSSKYETKPCLTISSGLYGRRYRPSGLRARFRKNRRPRCGRTSRVRFQYSKKSGNTVVMPCLAAAIALELLRFRLTCHVGVETLHPRRPDEREDEPRGELGIEVRRLLRHHLAGQTHLAHLRHAGRVQEEGRRRPAGRDRGDRLLVVVRELQVLGADAEDGLEDRAPEAFHREPTPHGREVAQALARGGACAQAEPPVGEYAIDLARGPPPALVGRLDRERLAEARRERRRTETERGAHQAMRRQDDHALLLHVREVGED